MNKDIEKEDGCIKEVEGILETPNVRTRDFNDVADLANWLSLTRPNNIKVDTGMLQGKRTFRLSVVG